MASYFWLEKVSISEIIDALGVAILTRKMETCIANYEHQYKIM
jgi:hypothetical protein